MTVPATDMQDETEAALIAIANPVAWVYHGTDSRYPAWRGYSEQSLYNIIVPSTHDDVDMLPQNRFRCLFVTDRQYGSTHRLSYATVEQAKALCLQHALTGDMTALRIGHRRLAVEHKMFRNRERAATKLLEYRLRQYKEAPWLT